MSLFGELDVASAEEIDYRVPDNSYTAFVFDVKVAETAKKDKVGMTITYKISEGEYADKTVQEWKQIPQPSDPKNPTEDEKRSLSYLKARMETLGIPAERMNTVGPDDLIGIEVVITLATKGEYQNVKKVVLKEDADGIMDRFGG